MGSPPAADRDLKWIAEAALAVQARGKTRLIAIDGRGGAGKTSLATLLSVEVGGAAVVHTDEVASADGPDLARLQREIVDPLVQGVPARYRAWDWSSLTLGGWRGAPPGGTVIIEGTGSMARDFADAVAFAVWIECSVEIRLARTLARDGEQVIGAWHRWTEWEDHYLAAHRPKERASVVLGCEA